MEDKASVQKRFERMESEQNTEWNFCLDTFLTCGEGDLTWIYKCCTNLAAEVSTKKKKAKKKTKQSFRQILIVVGFYRYVCL